MSAENKIAAKKTLIRPMREEDIPRAQEIDRVSFALPWPDNAYDYELHENPGSMLWVAETDETNEVVGFIVVWLIVDEAHIASLAVDPAYRNQGIAGQLLSEALKAVIRKGFRTATLEVRAHNLPAQKLYTSFGFKIVGIRPRYYRDNNEDALIMTIDDMDANYLEWLENRQNIHRMGEIYDA